MTIQKNLPLLLNLAYCGYNRGLPSSNGQRGDFQPQFNADGSVQVTYCNQFVQYITKGMGYSGFTGMIANEMHEFMANSKNGWMTVDDTVAQSHANTGVIVLASRANLVSGHGHVCIILPGILEKSLSWGKAVPKAANIGKDVFFGKKVSFAFTAQEMPTYFVLSEQI